MAGTIITQNIQGPSSGANANKILIPSGQTLDVSGGTLTPSAGAVIQTVHNNVGATVATNSNGVWTESNNVIEITPTSSSSKVLVFGQQPMRIDGTDNILRGGIRLKRRVGSGSYSVIWNTQGLTEMFQGRGYPEEISHVGAFSILDSPSTTDVARYVIEFNILTGSGYFQNWSGDRGATITAMEIAQ